MIVIELDCEGYWLICLKLFWQFIVHPNKCGQFQDVLTNLFFLTLVTLLCQCEDGDRPFWWLRRFGKSFYCKRWYPASRCGIAICKGEDFQRFVLLSLIPFYFDPSLLYWIVTWIFFTPSTITNVFNLCLFLGKIVLQNVMFGTRLLFNPDMPEVLSFRNGLVHFLEYDDAF